MSSLIGIAMHIAWVAHRGQLDKGGSPYIQHPLAVASKMETENEIITALLHDVVEDSDFTIHSLELLDFPKEVVDALKLLTHDPGVEYFDYILALKGNELAKKVKLADLEHNSRRDRLPDNPTEKDRKRLKKYAHARELLEDHHEQQI